MNAQYGLITEFEYVPLGTGVKLVAKVKVDDRVTNFLPVQTNANSFLIEHLPVAIDEQVIVINPDGNNEDGYITRSIPYVETPLPKFADANTYIKVFIDGTSYIHNTKTKEITLDTPCVINITTSKDIKLTAENINVTCTKALVTADKVDIDSKNIDLGLGGTGVQTNLSPCNLTGLPCNNGSTTVKATK